MHDLQRSVLKRLTLAPTLRYAELKPVGVEGNRFTYHLSKLAKDGLIKKQGSAYRLTAAGRRLADRMSLEQFQERIQPKIVTLIACADSAGRYLVYRRAKQPFFGKIGFPYGKIHLGERIDEAARREFKEKTGLSAKLVRRGDVYITITDEEGLVSHMLCHVFSGRGPSGTLAPRSASGESFWRSPAHISLEEEIPGFREIKRLLRTEKKIFFKEYFLAI